MNFRGIWALARSLGLGSDKLHEVVMEVTGKDSLRKLTQREKNQVTRTLRYALRHSYTIDQEQKNKIYKLGFLLHWNCKQIRGFVKVVVKKTDVNILQREEASKVIEGMKAILKRERNCLKTTLS